VLILALNVMCNAPQRAILEKFMDASPKELFKVFNLVFKRAYQLNSEEGLSRYKIFKQNLKLIKETNAKNLGYTFGINQFSDLTQEEFQDTYLMKPEVLKQQINGFLQSNPVQEVKNTAEIPKITGTIDWKSLYNPARQQGTCGSCWAFATAGTIEANWWNKNQKYKKAYLSPQQLVDCDRSNYGCSGGWYPSAFTHGVNYGLSGETDYAYRGVQGNCNINPQAYKYRIQTYRACENCNFNDWYALLAQGPVAILIDAGPAMRYNGGIFPLNGCGQPNHAIIAVGWQVDGQGNILTIRNSWGDYWGEKGYMRIRVQNDGNYNCQTLKSAYLAIPVVVG